MDSGSKTIAIGVGLVLIAATSGGKPDSAQPEVRQVVAEATGELTARGGGTLAHTAAAVPPDLAARRTDGGSNAPPSVAPSEQWDRVLADTLVRGDVVVPDGQRWLIGRNVQVAGNVRTHNGSIAMRPGSSLKFLGADPARYVGGGMHFTPGLHDQDIGLWIGAGHGARGMLDIQCTPKTGWNRTGVDPTWRPSDEYWIAPTALRDYTPRRWHPGQPVPRVDPRVPAAEVANVTRDCVIEGPGHIHIHSTVPQRIEYVRLENMGVVLPGGEPTSGRYALHLHMMGEGSDGMVVRGVAAVGSRGRVYVPHMSHGITFFDNVAVNSEHEVVWWDEPDPTNRVVFDRLLVLGVHDPAPKGRRADAIRLLGGTSMTMRNSVVAGVRGGALGNGFRWENPKRPHTNVWTFHDNVAHNNSADGIRFWTNLSNVHLVTDYIGYHNGRGGIEDGAYVNAVSYHDVLLVGNYYEQHANAKPGRDGSEPVNRRIRVFNAHGPAMLVGGLNLPASRYRIYEDCELEAGPGHPKVFVQRGVNPWLARFVGCGLVPGDIVFAQPVPAGLEGSHVVIDDGPGRRWEVRIENGRRVETPLR